MKYHFGFFISKMKKNKNKNNKTLYMSINNPVTNSLLSNHVRGMGGYGAERT